MMRALAITGLIATALLVSWRWRPRQPIGPGAWLLLIAYALLGAWALWFGLYAGPGQEPAALRFWKPTILYWVLCAIFIVAPLLGWGYPVKLVLGSYFVFSSREWRWINAGFAVLLALLGTWNLLAAFNSLESDWEGFKWSAMVNVVAVFLLRVSFVWLDAAARIFRHLYARAKALFS